MIITKYAHTHTQRPQWTRRQQQKRTTRTHTPCHRRSDHRHFTIVIDRTYRRYGKKKKESIGQPRQGDTTFTPQPLPPPPPTTTTKKEKRRQQTTQSHVTRRVEPRYGELVGIAKENSLYRCLRYISTGRLYTLMFTWDRRFPSLHPFLRNMEVHYIEVLPYLP